LRHDATPFFCVYNTSETGDKRRHILYYAKASFRRTILLRGTDIMKNVIFDSYDFEHIITSGSIYVDKTEMLHRLVTSKTRTRFFISRPRRFGKSLMLSTLKAIFEGRRELFDGLAITRTSYDWAKVPVLHLDMTTVLADTVDEIKQNIVNKLRRVAKYTGIQLEPSDFASPAACFGTLLEEMYRKFNTPLAVLVDEYDAPVNRLVEKEGDFETIRSVMHDFYVQLKANDASIRFLMMTGVSKFAKLSVFSGLNNLSDLTLEPEYAGMFGYTLDEINRYFSEHIRVFGDATGKSADEIHASLLDWYDGYRFSPYSTIRVTNPISLAMALDRQRFSPFWAETSHSSLIYKHLKHRGIIPAQLNGLVAGEEDLDYCELTDANSPALLFQTGYLTIDKDLSDGRLQFRIPNKEVANALTTGMLSYIFKGEKWPLRDRLDFARNELQRIPDKSDAILEETLTAAFNAIPYDWTIKDEVEARRMFLFYCSLMGADVIGEVHSPKGRADAVLLLPETVFVFEFKYGHTSQEALAQAESRNYAAPFLNGNRQVYLIGVNYNPDKRNIDSPCCRRMQ